ALDVAEIGKVRVEEVVIDAPIPGLDATAARNPNRRMRLLDRPRPDINVAELRVFAVESERLGLGPGAQHELAALVIFIAQGRRRFAIGIDGVERRADGEAGDETSA